MSSHRATCTDCPWSYVDEDIVDVSDEMERHSLKEQHHVDLERAVATDGGRHEVKLTKGEEALYCLDCEAWLPCECDGVPANAEIRVYGDVSPDECEHEFFERLDTDVGDDEFIVTTNCHDCGAELRGTIAKGDMDVVVTDGGRPEDVKERSLAHLRDALSALNKVPAAGVSGAQHDLLVDARDKVSGLEAALKNEVEQRSTEEDDA